MTKAVKITGGIVEKQRGLYRPWVRYNGFDIVFPDNHTSMREAWARFHDICGSLVTTDTGMMHLDEAEEFLDAYPGRRDKYVARSKKHVEKVAVCRSLYENE
jgi:hypothetical protein